MLGSFLLYVSVFLFIFFGGYIFQQFFDMKKKRNKILLLLISCIPLFLLCALKSDYVGRDTSAYKIAYETLGGSPWNSIKYNSFELGFCIILKIFSKIGLSFRVFSIILYFACFALLAYSVYKNSEDFSTTFFLIAVLIVPFGMSAQRQFLSLCIVAVSIVFAKNFSKKNIIIFILLIVLASSIHVSSLSAIVLPLFFVKAIKLNAKIFSIFVTMLVILFFVSPAIYQFVVYNFFSDTYLPIDGGSGNQLWLFLLILVVLYLFKNYSLSEPSKFIFANSGFFCISLYALVFLAFVPASNVFPRFYFTFIIGFCILLSNYFKNLKFKKNIEIPLLLLLFCGFVALFYFQSIRGNGLDIWPYKLFF